MAGAGITDSDGQLQSPLAWDPTTESIYYTVVKKNNNHGARMAMRVALKTNSTTELTMLRVGDYEKVSSSRSTDMALDSAGERLAFIDESGLKYISLADEGIHSLPPQDDWLWLKDAILSDIEWLSPSRIAFTSLGNDGIKSWAVWDIPDAKVLSFGRGSDSGSWDVATGRLALLQSTEGKVSILTPNWQDSLSSALEVFTLPWQSVTW